MATKESGHEGTQIMDSEDRATVTRLAFLARRDRKRFGWVAVICAAMAVVGAIGAFGTHGRGAKRWGTFALCSGLLAGLAGLARAGSRTAGLAGDLDSGIKEVWRGHVSSLRRAGYHGSQYVLVVDGRTFTLPSDRRMPVEQGDECEVHVGLVSGQVLRIERRTQPAEGI